MALNLASNERKSIQAAAAQFAQQLDPFTAARETTFSSMHADAWPRFVKHRLSLAQNQVIREHRTGEVSRFRPKFCEPS